MSSSSGSGACAEHERPRALVQRALRRAVGVALDAPVRRIGVSAVIRAISSAFEFTHTLWPSRFGRYAGRSDTTASSASFGGQPRGNASWDQPPPRIHGSSGCAAT